MTTQRDMIRPLVRGVYDFQQLRIQMGNRLAANFKSKLGQKPGETEEDSLSSDAAEVLEKLRLSYKLLGTAVAEFKKAAKAGKEKEDPAIFHGDELIENISEFVLVEQYLDLEDQEKRAFKRLHATLAHFPIFTDYLSKIKGIGPAMSAVIISEIDIHKSKYVSSIWKYAGLDVAPDGAGRSRRAEHLIDREYINAKGEPAVRKSITFNPWLKTKLIGVLASSFLRAGNEKYRKIYDDYKHRLENHDKHKEKTKGHRHDMALRYMIKIFIIDLYANWRKMEGLEVAPTYQEAKLGHKHAA